MWCEYGKWRTADAALESLILHLFCTLQSKTCSGGGLQWFLPAHCSTVGQNCTSQLIATTEHPLCISKTSAAEKQIFPTHIVIEGIVLFWTDNIWLTLSTFALVLAEVSTYGTDHCCALACASSIVTCRLSSRSALFPTSKNGMFSSFFTRRICSLQWFYLFSTCQYLVFLSQNARNEGIQSVRPGSASRPEDDALMWIPKLRCGLKRFLLGDAEHTKEALSWSEVVVSYCGVVFLASCVKYVNLDFFTVQYNLLPVGIRFGRFVVFHKLKKAHRSARDFSVSVTHSRLCFVHPSQTPIAKVIHVFGSGRSPHRTWTVASALTFRHPHCQPWSLCGSQRAAVVWLWTCFRSQAFVSSWKDNSRT